jgi:hypothetical protein
MVVGVSYYLLLLLLFQLLLILELLNQLPIATNLANNAYSPLILSPKPILLGFVMAIAIITIPTVS